MCDCLAILGRVIIGFLSLIFAVLGFGLLVIGVIVKVQSDTLKTLYDPLVQMAKSQFQSASGQDLNIPLDNFNIDELVGGLAIAFIVLGVVMFIIGLFGLVGGCCQVKCMVIGYLIMVGLLTAGMITIVVILAVNRDIVTGPPKVELTKTLQAEYQGLNGSDVTSLLWNAIMTWQQCCGIGDYKDFDKATKWKSFWGPSTSFTYDMPAACCKSGEFNPPDTTCTLTASSTNNKDTGCYDLLLDLLLTGTTFIAFSCGTCCFLGLLTFLSAAMLYKIVKKKNKVQPM